MDTTLHSAYPEPGDGPEREAFERRARHARRLAALDEALAVNVAAIKKLGQYIDGALTPDHAEPFARIDDPTQALERLTRAIGRTVAMQERLDIDDETRSEQRRAAAEARANRLMAEQAECERAARERPAQEAARLAEAASEKTKWDVRRALRDILRVVQPGLDHTEREDWLDRAFDAYEIYDDFSNGRDVVLTRICEENGLEFEYEWPDSGGRVSNIVPRVRKGGKTGPVPVHAANVHDPPG